MRTKSARRIDFLVNFLMYVITIALCSLLIWFFLKLPGSARDDGRYANSPLKPWFDKLASGKGLCCSFADGVKLEDVDWDTKDSHYRVKLPAWISGSGSAYQVIVPASKDYVDVPDDAVITEPNKFGPAVVWPYKDANGKTAIRCFMPGAGT